MSVDILKARPIKTGAEGSLNMLTASQVVDIVKTFQRTPLPDGDLVFPWLHGMSQEICPQTLYVRQKAAGKHMVPELLIPINVGNTRNQIVNSVLPTDILQTSPNKVLLPQLVATDPERGVNLRNVKSQAAKCLPYATILVYSFDDPSQILPVVELLQQALHKLHAHKKILMYTGTAAELDEIDPQILIKQEEFTFDPDNHPHYTQWDLNFPLYERLEILHMSKATPVELADVQLYIGNGMDPAAAKWDTLIECVAHAVLPTISRCDHYIRSASVEETNIVLEFPASDTVDPASISAKEVVAMLNVCKAVHARSQHGKYTLVVSPEGYRGNTLFSILYGMFVTGKGMADVFTHLHRVSGRPLLCSDADVEVCRTLEALLTEFCPSSELAKQSEGAISASKVGAAFARLTEKMYQVPTDAFANFNGSLPSKILDYMYLGALRHAQYPDFILQLGITRVLSVGEQLPWINYVEGQTLYKNPYPGIEEVLYLPNILDDGVDSLLPVLDQCYEYLDCSYEDNAKTLVHCRVGVSRSAAICIAEVMKRFDWNLPRSYLFVRVRRLNLIIQPNLRFLYDLMKVEEHMNLAKGLDKIREIEWPLFCREISRINS